MKLMSSGGVLAAILLACQWLAVGAEPQKKVLIIGVDGTRPSALAGAKTPVLNALKAGGCFSDRAVTHPVTHSAACWTSMFTGVWGDKHLVNDPGNSFAGNRLDLYPNFMKRLELVNSNYSTVAFTRWSGLASALSGVDRVQNYDSDDAVTAATCTLLTNGNPDVFYTILLDVDSAGHSAGWFSSTYTNRIGEADTRIGRIMNALTNRVTYTNEDWLVFVLSDHGMHDDPDIEKSRVTFHLVWGPSAARRQMWPSPSIVDVCATALTHMGVPIEPAWNLDARVEGLPLPPPSYGTNLIFNGNAECNSGTNNYVTNRGIAWWFDVTGTSLGCYGSNSNFPGDNAPGPADRGRNFFLGGSGDGLIQQRIDISALAGDLEDPGVRYRLSGWFGGAGAQEDAAWLAVRFLDEAGKGLATNQIGGVTAAQRGQLTGLAECATNGFLPTATRYVEFTLTNHVVSGLNDGSADNLAFVLEQNPEPAFTILPLSLAGEGWAVGITDTLTNRVYQLRRSIDLETWVDVGEAASGNGGTLTLQDTSAPASQAFYRVARRKP